MPQRQGFVPMLRTDSLYYNHSYQCTLTTITVTGRHWYSMHCEPVLKHEIISGYIMTKPLVCPDAALCNIFIHPVHFFFRPNEKCAMATFMLPSNEVTRDSGLCLNYAQNKNKPKESTALYKLKALLSTAIQYTTL